MATKRDLQREVERLNDRYCKYTKSGLYKADARGWVKSAVYQYEPKRRYGR